MTVLLELENHYAGLLNGVRALIAAEQGRGSDGDGARPAAVAPANGTFASMTKADAAEQILKDRGKLRTQALFEAMKGRGHPVASKMSLYNMLNTNGRFKRKGRGIWTLSNS